MYSHDHLFWPLDCIPAIQDGETLFSWCSLYHRISGTTFAETTSKRLFSSRTGGFVRDFPGRIDYFVRITDGELGDANHIINEHTLIRLYTKFRSVETINEVLALMRGRTVERLKFVMGLPSSRANSCHPLKFCRKCVEEEVEEQGFARWWRNYQWPTVWICERHGQLLDWAKDGAHGSLKSAWVLPSDLKSDDVVMAPTISVSSQRTLLELARLTVNVANNSDGKYLPETLKLTFLAMIKERGWVSAYGSIQYAYIRKAFLSKYEELSGFPGMEFIDSVSQDDYGFLGVMVRGRNTYLHPSKYLLMINLLFNDFESFQTTFRKYSGVANTDSMRMLILDPDRKQREDKLLIMVMLEKRPLNQVAQLMNMSIVSVINWAKRNGLEYERRPHLETDQLLVNIGQLIAQGVGRDEMASELGVRRRWLSSFFVRHPDLLKEWQRQNLDSVTRIRRAAFKMFINEHQGIPLRKLLSIPANGYRWLLKNDKQWLEDNMPLMHTDV